MGFGWRAGSERAASRPTLYTHRAWRYYVNTGAPKPTVFTPSCSNAPFSVGCAANVITAKPHPHSGRDGDHRRRLVLASALRSADTVEASTDPVIRIRPPVANSISTMPACSDDGAGRAEVAGSGTGATTAGSNATGPGARLQSSCRHR